LETNFKNKFPSIRKVFDVDETSSNNKKSRGAIPNEHCCWIQEIISQVIFGAIRVTPTTGEEIAHFNLAMLKESSHSTVPISSSRDGDLEKIASDSLDMRTHIRCEDPIGACPNTWSSNSQLTKNVYNSGRTNMLNNKEGDHGVDGGKGKDMVIEQHQ